MSKIDELIKKADAGDMQAQLVAANNIIFENKGPIDPDMAQRAIRYYENAANHGIESAMIDLGVIYRFGKGVARDMDKCFFWTKKATSKLNPLAFQYLGYHHEIPVGYADINDDKADYKTVFDCFFKGAVLGDSICMYKVGDMYYSGKFVEKDQQYAYLLYKRSEELSDYPSAGLSLRLGECYCMGLGTEQDIEKACERIEYAVNEYEWRSRGDDDPMFYMEQFNRAKHLLKRINADKIPGRPIDLTTKKKDDDYAAFVASEHMNFPEPVFPIAEIDKLKSENPIITYLPGEVSFNEIFAKAETGDTYAMYHLAMYIHQRFWFDMKDASMIDFTLHYFCKSACGGYSPAMYSLGIIYRNGEGVPVDMQKAFLFFEHSNEIIAGEEIGKFYLDGEIVSQDYEKAYNCFIKCALFKEKYDYAALPELSRMYRDGLFVDTDKQFADYLEEQSKKRSESAEIVYEKG